MWLILSHYLLGNSEELYIDLHHIVLHQLEHVLMQYKKAYLPLCSLYVCFPSFVKDKKSFL